MPARRWAHGKYLLSKYWYWKGTWSRPQIQPTVEDVENIEIYLSKKLLDNGVNALTSSLWSYMDCGDSCVQGAVYTWCFLMLLQYFMRRQLILISSPTITPESPKRCASHVRFSKTQDHSENEKSKTIRGTDDTCYQVTENSLRKNGTEFFQILLRGFIQRSLTYSFNKRFSPSCWLKSRLPTVLNFINQMSAVWSERSVECETSMANSKN